MLLDTVRRGMARPFAARSIRERRSVGTLSICFDGFPRSAWTEGGAILRSHGVRGTFYLAGGLCGTEFEGHRMYNGADLEAISAEGHEIGCQTFDHKSCLRRSASDLARSIAANDAFVRRHLGDVRMVSFAYPLGDASFTAKLVAVRHFATARGVDSGLNRGWLDLSQLKSVKLGCGSRMDEIDSWIARAASLGAWLTIHTHSVGDRPGSSGCRPREIERLIRVARAAGLEILTVKGALGSRAFAAPR